MAADTIITKLQNGNVVITKGGRNFSYYPDMQVLEDEGDSVHVRDKSSSQQHVFFVDDVIKVVRKDGTETPISDKSTLFYELSTFFFFKLGGGGSTHLGVFINYTDLITQYPTAATGDLAYVENSQGTFWLPGGMGGNFYSKGVYMFNGVNWDSSVDEISKQLEENTNDILSLQTALTNHVNDLANPHDTTIANLDDTTITSPLNGEILTYSGGAWINGSPSVGVPTFNSVAWDVTTDTLPITSSAVDFLTIDFSNFNGNIDLTSQLPVNLNTGAKVTLRKSDTTNGKIIYNDGVILYNFINKQGEYLSLYWDGTKYII